MTPPQKSSDSGTNGKSLTPGSRPAFQEAIEVDLKEGTANLSKPHNYGNKQDKNTSKP